MKNKTERSPINAQIYEEACEWFLEFRLEQPDILLRKSFDAWMRRSPEHIAAYLEVSAVWSDSAAHDSRRKWDTETLIAQARAAPDNVLSLTGNRRDSVGAKDRSDEVSVARSASVAGESSEMRSAPVRNDVSNLASGSVGGRSRAWVYAVAASLMLAVFGSAAIFWSQLQGQVYRTSIGEQRSIRLDDGSIVDLNSKTIVSIRYREHERRIDIKQGQAFFQVVSDPDRPFIVDSNGVTVRAVGTQFDVYRKTAGTVVTVVEGSVAVTPAAIASHRPRAENRTLASKSSNSAQRADGVVLVRADEQVTVAPNVPPRIEKGTASIAIAWKRRKMVFIGASLTEVAEEFNRYSGRRLVIENPGEYDFRVSGVFSSADITAIVRFLQTRSEVEIQESAREIRIRKKADMQGYLPTTVDTL